MSTGDDNSEEVVNWEPPKKIDLVERATSDGVTDPAAIVEMASRYKVSLTIDEVINLKTEIKKRNNPSF